MFPRKIKNKYHLCFQKLQKLPESRSDLLVVVKFLDFRLFTTGSYKLEVLQAKEKSTEFPQTDC